jgi:bifunctional non-homologous end joining protein LigD
MTLATYRKKRDFRRTTEPRGRGGQRKHSDYVIHCHAASHLHYDLRLALDGVLKSWAVPKGPSLDPGQKRLAIEVEDHPLEYGNFEGAIPEGEYGAGTVMIWDRGRWQPDGDPRKGLRDGKLEFHLDGEKLHGGWVLVRSPQMVSRAKNAWLLIKRRDADARPAGDGDVLAEMPNSVKTGRSLDEIAAGWPAGKRTRSSSAVKARGKEGDGPVGAKVKPRGSPSPNGRHTALSPAPSPATGRGENGRGSLTAGGRGERVAETFPASGSGEIPGARRAKLPATFRPQLATLAAAPPTGDRWWHETKFDGVRMALWIDRKHIELFTRQMHSWTRRLPHLVDTAKQLAVRSAIIDGELVALGADGTSSFEALQTAFRDDRAPQLVYYAFDILYLDGYDLTGCPLEARKDALAGIVPPREEAAARVIRFSEHSVGQGARAFAKACRQGLEGIISKRRDAPYVAARGPTWLKLKCVKRQEFVIGGYTDPEGARLHLGSLLLGYYEGKKLVYAGRVGTGFDDRTLGELLERLGRFKQPKPPFAAKPVLRGRTRGIHWVAPRLIAEIQFANWTRDGMLRQASFQGLREDKNPREVVREEPAALGEVEPQLPPRRRPVEPGRAAETREPASDGEAATAAVRRELASLGVRLTHPDKVLYEGQGITKLDLAEYYAQISEWILPHVAGRPLMLVRCPEGSQGECFRQKHATKGKIERVRLVPLKESGKTRNYLVIDDLAGLLALVQLGALEIHVWGSRADDLERPDRLVFDLDPDPALPWSRVVESAGQLHAFFDDLGLRTFLKTTGGKGLHVVVPIARKHAWPEVAEFCRAVATAVAGADPRRYTPTLSKAARRGKIFLDYLRNGRGATAVAAYSTRARPGAPVSTPVGWEELDGNVRSDQFTVENLPARLQSLKRDPWEELDAIRQTISSKIEKRLGIKRL